MEKRNIFERVRLKNGQKKKNETKRRRKIKGVSHRDEKNENETSDSKETKILQKKERKVYFLEKVFSKEKRRVNLRRVDRESEHQEGTYKERKHEKNQNKKEKKRET